MNFFTYEADPNAFFDMYTPMHGLMTLLFIIVMIVFFVFKNRIFNSSKEKTARYILAVILAINMIVLAIIEYSAGHIWLPFHLCSMSLFLTIVLLFTNNEKVFDFVFFTGIIGGIVSFAIPDLGNAGYTRFKFYEFIIAHSAIIYVPIYYLTCYKYKITKQKLIKVMIMVNIIGLIMWPINILLRNTGIAVLKETNYMFTMGAPEDVEAVFGQYPWHLFTFEGVLLVTFFILFYFGRKYSNKKTA